MRYLLGLCIVGAMFVGGGALAWKGLGLDQELAPDPAYWSTADRSVVTMAPSDVSPPVVQVESGQMTTPVKSLSLPPMPSAGRVVLPGFEVGVIAVPDNARAGSGGQSTSNGRSASPRQTTRPRAPGLTFGLQGRNEFSRTLDARMHAKPRFGFTPQNRKREIKHGSRVNTIRN